MLDPEGKLIQSIRAEDAAGLYENGTVTGGMIPKLNCCIDAIEQGVEKVMIVDGRVENCVLLELLTDQGVGTEIVGESAEKKRRGGWRQAVPFPSARFPAVTGIRFAARPSASTLSCGIGLAGKTSRSPAFRH